MRLFLVLVVAAICNAQVTARVSLSNGTQVSIATRSDNGTPITLKTSLAPASGDSFYRIFRDENNLAVFAYELEVARTPDGENFRVTAKPATEDFATRFPNADGGKPTPTLSAKLESPLLSSGQSFPIPIPSDPGLGQTLTDTVQVIIGQRGGANDAVPASAQIRFADLRVFIKGQQVTPSGAGADVAGRFAMFYIPGRGGYFFSTDPVDERPFLQVGVVDGKHLTFTVDNDMYDATTSAPILVHADRGQLWVYHDPNYKPAGNWTKADLASNREEFFTAASDSLQWWVQ
ncbi:MAG TPA: hypothetical protein VK686_13735 [Bryobacteraceae bacterium]|nr:hypothetical protein [Bryobacteraceae bacterium]